MEPFLLTFDNYVIELEKRKRWKTLVEHVYRQWNESPMSLPYLLCAGTELWYTILVMEKYRNSPLPPPDTEIIAIEDIEEKLMAVTRFGFEHFSNDGTFNAYFGYMINAMPYFFADYGGDYDGWREKGINMMKNAYQLAPTNPFAKAISLEPNSFDRNLAYYNACKNLWTKITPTKWGISQVQQYFFGILCGYSFYPNAYE